MGIAGGLVCGIVTGNHSSLFDPLPVDHFFDDMWAWDECEIDHRVLFNLQIKHKEEMDMSKQINFKQEINNIARTIQDEQDLDALNIERRATNDTD